MADDYRLARSAGERDGRPAFVHAQCPSTSTPTYYQARYAGERDGRPCYVRADCIVGEAVGRYALAKYAGERDGRPVYVRACCPGCTQCCDLGETVVGAVVFDDGQQLSMTLTKIECSTGTDFGRAWVGGIDISSVCGDCYDLINPEGPCFATVVLYCRFGIWYVSSFVGPDTTIAGCFSIPLLETNSQIAHVICDPECVQFPITVGRVGSQGGCWQTAEFRGGSALSGSDCRVRQCCCPSNPISRNLCFVLSSGCGCVNGIASVLYRNLGNFASTDGGWAGGYYIDQTNCDVPNDTRAQQLFLRCEDGWKLRLGSSNISVTDPPSNGCVLRGTVISNYADLVSSSCNPFQLVFTATLEGLFLPTMTCGCTGQQVTITITEYSAGVCGALVVTPRPTDSCGSDLQGAERTLTVLVTQTGGTPCGADGATFDIVFGAGPFSGRWYGSGGGVAIDMGCDFTFGTDIFVQMWFDSGTGNTSSPTFVTNYDPLEITATGLTLVGGGCNGATFTVTIME